MKTTLVLGIAVFAAAGTTWASPLREGVRDVNRIPTPLVTRVADGPIDAEPITELPEGNYELKKYARDSQQFYVELNGQVFFGDDSAFSSEIAFYDNGDVYIKNPISGYYANTYIKGRLDGNVITVDFPQVLNIHKTSQYTYIYEVDRLEYTETLGDNDVAGVDYVVSETVPNSMTFTIDETTGEIRQEEDAMAKRGELPDVIMGVKYNHPEDGFVWAPYGDCNQVYYTFTQEPMSLPDGLQSETWVMSFYQNSLKYTQDTKMIEVAFAEDGTVYLGNLYNDDMKGHYIKGQFLDGVLRVPSYQYVGLNEETNHYAYMVATSYEQYYDESANAMRNRLKLESTLELDYDEAEKTLFSNMVLTLNNGNHQLYPITSYVEPVVKYYDLSNPAEPATPVWALCQLNLDDDYDHTAIWLFNLPKEDVNGVPLDPERMYFNIWYDETPFCLYEQDYPGIVEDTYNIPYLFNNQYNVMVNGTLHQVLAYFYEDYSTVKLQSVYVKEDGTELKSAVAVTRSSVEEIGESAVKSVEYYDMLGRKVRTPGAGIWVKSELLEDGTVRTSKIRLR